MDKATISLSKTCSSCGQQKPMSAFLEIAGSQGTTYGNICASCRKTHMEKLSQPKEPEENTTSRTGLKIDNKSKVQEEKEKKELHKQIADEYADEREKLGEKTLKKEQKKQSIAADEKKHREEKRSFFDRSITAKKEPSKTFGADRIQANQEQKIKTEVDYRFSTENTERVSGAIKTNSAVFNTFKTFLGKNANKAAIVRAAEKAATSRTNENTADMEPLNEAVENNYRPRSK